MNVLIVAVNGSKGIRMDTLTPAERSVRMSLVRGKNTKPEVVVQKLLRMMGYRFTLHRNDLPGSPDLTIQTLKCAIFVHGCFWHQHECPNGNRIPKSRVGFWRAKLGTNVLRDRRKIAKLRRNGWRVMVVWECQLRDLETVRKRLALFLSRNRKPKQQ